MSIIRRRTKATGAVKEVKMRHRSVSLAEKRLCQVKQETTRLKTEYFGGNMRDPKTREAYEKFKTPGYHKVLVERQRQEQEERENVEN
jgi:hypothetical protein